MSNMQETIKYDLEAMKQVFTEADIPWSITDGLVLGYARNGEIMGWDDDLDIGIFVEVTNEQWNNLSTIARKHGFTFPAQKRAFFHGTRRSAWGCGMFQKKSGFYECRPESTPNLKFLEKISWHDAPQIIEFQGDIYPMPNNIEDYCDCRYGKGWMTNIVKDAQAFFIEKRGSLHDQTKWPEGRCGKNGDLWPKILKREDTL